MYVCMYVCTHTCMLMEYDRNKGNVFEKSKISFSFFVFSFLLFCFVCLFVCLFKDFFFLHKCKFCILWNWLIAKILFLSFFKKNSIKQPECSRLQQRSVITFLVAGKCKPCEIFRRVWHVNREACFNQKNVYKKQKKKSMGLSLRVDGMKTHWLSGKDLSSGWSYDWHFNWIS